MTVDVPERGAVEICFSADRWAELSGFDHVPPLTEWEPALREKVCSYAAAGVSLF